MSFFLDAPIWAESATALTPGSPSFLLTSQERQDLTTKYFNDKTFEKTDSQGFKKKENYNLLEHAIGVTQGTAINLVDDLWGNRLNPLGDKGDVWDMVGTYGGPMGRAMKRYYDSNEGVLDVSSGLLGAVGVGYLTAAKALPWLAGRLASSTAITGSRLWQAGSQYNVAVRAAVHQKNLAAAVRQEYATAWNALGRGTHLKLLGLESAKLAGVAAIEEAAIITLMNANDLIYDPEDLAATGFYASLGVGIGAIGGAIRGRRILRGMANDPAVIDARAKSQDPVGITRRSEGEILPSILTTAQAAPGASITRYALQHYQAIPANQGVVTTRVDVSSVESLSALKQDLLKKGFSEPQAKEWATEILKSDPLSLHGIEQLKPARGANWIQETLIRKNQSPNNLQRITEIQQATDTHKRMAAHFDGQWLPIGSSREVEQLVLRGAPVAPVVRALSPNLTEEIQLTMASGKQEKLSLASVPKVFDSLDLVDRLQFTEGYKAFFEKLQTLKYKFSLPGPADAHWIQYDAAVQFEKQGGEISYSPAAQKAGITDVNTLKQASLKLKAVKILNDPLALKNPVDFVKYNLPVPTYMERLGSTVGDQFRLILKAAENGATLADLQRLRATMQEISGYARQGSGPTSLEGNLFNFNRNAKKEWIEPVVATFKDSSLQQQTRILDAATDAMVEHKMHTIATLIDRQNPSFVSNLARTFLENPNFAKASRVHGIADDQITGLGSAAAQIAGETRTMEFRARDNATMLSLTRLRELVTRQSDAYLTSLVERHMRNAHEQLIGGAAHSSRQLLQQFDAYSRGWDLEEIPVELGMSSGPAPRQLWGFRLSVTPRNAERLGIDVERMDSEMLLQNPRTNQDIVLDDVGLNFQTRFNSLSTELLKNRNRVRQAANLPPIAYRNWYVPPQNVKNKIVGFVFDAHDNIVPNRSVIAATPEEYNRLARVLEEDLKTSMPGARIRTREQVAAYKDVFDDAQMDWLDPTILVAPSKTQKGGLGTEFINPNSVQDIMIWIRDQAESLGNATQRLLLDDQIRSARTRHNVEVSVGSATKTGRTIYQEYEALARGIPLSELESSISGPRAKELTRLGNQMLTAVWPGLTGVSSKQAARWIHDIGQKMQVPSAKMEAIAKNLSSYKQLAEELGPYSPYKGFEDYLTQVVGHPIPPDIRKISQKLNTMSAALILRYVDISHASMNMMGLMTTMPALIRSGRAPVTSIPYGTAGKSISILDSNKILAGAIADMTHGRSGPDWNYMVQNGDASQQVAELNKQISLLTDRSGFGTVIFGTGTAQGKRGAVGLFKEKGIDGLLSVMTDKTENWSRQYAHFVGLRLADLHGITGREARHAFAREIANAGIANYSIVNRPELYQSPLGALFGLFTSWQRAYNQRLFRWLEEGQYTRVAEQYAIQAAMFGTKSAPGFNALNFLFEKGVGERDDTGQEVPTVVDRIYARLGPVAGLAVANGGIAAFSGMSLWTRGDANIRTPTLNPFDNVPALNILSKIKNIGADLVTYGLNPEMISESLGRNIPNRAMRGAWTEAVMGGKEIDANGRLISESQTILDTAARYAGIRSARSQQQVELYYANSAAMRDDAARLETLRMETRTMLRSKKPDSQDWLNTFEKYTKTGGNPANFQSWIRSQMREVSTPKDVRQLEGFMNNPNTHLRLWRHDAYMRGFY